MIPSSVCDLVSISLQRLLDDIQKEGAIDRVQGTFLPQEFIAKKIFPLGTPWNMNGGFPCAVGSKG
jgi:hypothetical protein